MTKARDTASLVSSQTGIAVTISGDPVILGVGNTQHVAIQGSGRIGIGTTNPGGPLHILGDGGYTPNLTLHAKGDKTANWILFKDDGGNTGFVGYGSNEDDSLALWNYTNESIRLGTNSTERVRITNSGTVGIGTTTSSNYTVAIRGTADNPNPTHGSLYLYGTEYAFIGFNNDNNEGGNCWFIGHRNAQTNDALSLRYGSGPGNGTGSLYLHNTHMVSVGSAVTTGTPNQTFQVVNGGGYFANHLSVGTTGNYQTFSLYGNQWMNGNTYITWNQGDVILQGLNVASGYGISISSYNATMTRMVPSIVSSGANKSVGINTTATLSGFGLVVQKEDGNTYETGITGAIYARGSIYSYAGQYLGGLGSMSTSGTTDWNDATNARSGNGYTLLTGNATNGPTGVGNYYHAINFEYSSKDGSGNLTQLAIPYYGAGYDVYYRTRYGGTWSSWTAV